MWLELGWHLLTPSRNTTCGETERFGWLCCRWARCCCRGRTPSSPSGPWWSSCRRRASTPKPAETRERRWRSGCRDTGWREKEEEEEEEKGAEEGGEGDSPRLSSVNRWRCWGPISWPTASTASCCRVWSTALQVGNKEISTAQHCKMEHLKDSFNCWNVSSYHQRSGEGGERLPVWLAKALSSPLLSGVAGRDREAWTAESIFTLSCVGELGADILLTSDCLSRTASSCLRSNVGEKNANETLGKRSDSSGVCGRAAGVHGRRGTAAAAC